MGKARDIGLRLGIKPMMLGWCFAAAVACKQSTSNNAISTNLGRSGSELAATAFQFIDWQPSLSDDGSKVIFVSGRDTNAQDSLLKVYKASWPVGQAPGTPARATSTKTSDASDIGSEREGQLSPDGTWIALIAAKAGKTDIYLQDFAGAQAPVAITTDGVAKKTLRFSADGKLLAWITYDTSAETATAQVAAIGSGTAASIGAAVAVTTSTQFVQQVFWLPAAANSYILVTGIGIPAAGQAPDTATTITYAQWTFASAAAAAAAQSTTWLTGFTAALATAPFATAQGAVLFRQNADPEAEQINQIGDGFDPNHTATTVPVRSEPVFLAPGATSTPLVYPATKEPGYQVTAAAATNDASALFMISHNYFRCFNDPDFSPGEFGSMIVVGKPNDVTSQTAQISPKLTALNGQYRQDYTEAYDVGSGPCDRQRPDNRTSRTDTNLTDIAVNHGGNGLIYRLAYVTRNSMYFDGACSLLAADPEVWLVDVTGLDAASHKFYNLSNNRPVPPAIGDDDRADQPACTF